MHICPKDDRLAPHPTWCVTLGECQVCGGLVCEHGCQRHPDHVVVPPPGRHAADPIASVAREATTAPYIGRHR